MYQGKHVSKKKTRRKKSLGLAMALVLLIAAAAGSTIAYLSNSSAPVENDFAPSDITPTIEETVSGGVKSSVKVTNSGETTAYIRVAVVANTVDEDGNITGSADVSGFLGNTGWVKSGNFYYYTSPVAPDASTGELLSGSIDLSGIQVTILAEAIQAQPAAAVESAWGVNPANL